jgi:hypothetical protein
VKDPNKTGTEFNTGTTEHGNNENGLPTVPMMSPQGAALAKKSAPTSAMDGKIAKYGGNLLHDGMLPIFKK